MAARGLTRLALLGVVIVAGSCAWLGDCLKNPYAVGCRPTPEPSPTYPPTPPPASPSPSTAPSPSPTPSWPPCEHPPCTCWVPAEDGGYYQIPCPSPSALPPSPSPSPTAPPPTLPPTPPPATCEAPPEPPRDRLVPFKAPPCAPGFVVVEIEGAGRRCVARSSCTSKECTAPDGSHCVPCSPSGIRYKWQPDSGVLYNAKRGEWMDAYCRRSIDGLAPVPGPESDPGYYGVCRWASPCPPQPSPSPTAPPTPQPGCPPPKMVKFAGGGACVGKPLEVPGGLECFLTATQRYASGPCEPGRDGWLTECCGREQDDPRGPEWTLESDGCVVSIEDRGNPFNRFVVANPGCEVRSTVCAREPLVRRVTPCTQEPCADGPTEVVPGPEPRCWQTKVVVQ